MMKESMRKKKTRALWYRFFARLFDFLIVFALCYAAADRWLIEGNRHTLLMFLLLQIVACWIMLLIEPLMICWFKTTPGKAIFGIKITDNKGVCLSYGQAYRRSFALWRHALGYGLPFYRLVVMGRLYVFRHDSSPRHWEEFI